LEITGSRQYLKDVSGQAVNYFAYPFGDYNLKTAIAVRNAGYQNAFVVDSNNVGLPEYEIQRVGIYNCKAGYLDLKLSGLHRTPVKGSIKPEVLK